MKIKSSFLIILFGLTIFYFGAAIKVEGAIEPFKIMTYNIEESGANSDWKQVVKEENADIIAFVETGAWDDNNNALLNQYCQEFSDWSVSMGENPYYCEGTENVPYDTSGEAVFSRFPISSKKQIALLTLDDGSTHDPSHDFLDVVIDIDGISNHLIASHLKCCSGDPTNEDKRNKQQEGIINYMDDLGNVPIMYMGDLNSFSPVDTEDPNLEPDRNDLGVGPMTMMIMPDDPTYGQYSSTIHTWLDAFRELNPEDPGYTYGHQANNLDGRIDFITLNQHFSIDYFISSTVGDTSTADTGSDHYAVDLIIDLSGSGGGDSTPPAQVTGLTANAVSSSQIDLSWDPNTENDLDHYNIYRDGSFLAQIAAGTTSYSDTGLITDTTYTYEVSAIDTSGNEGQKSTSVSATTQSGSSTPDTMHVHAIDWDESYIRGRTPHYKLTAFITILDNNGNMVFDATVTIDWTFPDGSTTRLSVTTDSNGIATFTIEPADKGTHTVTVVDVTGNLIYDSSQNVETTDSYTIS